MDEADRANEEIERGLAEALRIQRQRTAVALPESDECHDCGAELEPHRRAYGICVPCKVARELRDRFRATGV